MFEPNSEHLPSNIRSKVADFLYMRLGRNGGLIGAKPKEACFARCGRTTMAAWPASRAPPLRPPEFDIFRIGQRTAGSKE